MPQNNEISSEQTTPKNTVKLTTYICLLPSKTDKKYTLKSKCPEIGTHLKKQKAIKKDHCHGLFKNGAATHSAAGKTESLRFFREGCA